MTPENKDEFGTCPFDTSDRVLDSERESPIEKCAARRVMDLHLSENNHVPSNQESSSPNIFASEGEHAPGDGVQFPRTDYSIVSDGEDDWITVSGTSDSDNSFFVEEGGDEDLVAEDVRRSPKPRRQVASLRLQPPPPPPPSPAPLTPPPVLLAARSGSPPCSPRALSESPLRRERGGVTPPPSPPQETGLTPSLSDDEEASTSEAILQGESIYMHQSDSLLQEIPTS